MASSLNLTPAAQVFSCPTCSNTINATMHVCPFCQTQIDSTTAEREAAATSKSNAACSDASYLRILLTMFFVFLALMLVPFIGLVGLAGTWFIRIALPIMCIRWWIKYGRVHTTDPDFSRARTSTILVSVAAIVVFCTFAIHIR